MAADAQQSQPKPVLTHAEDAETARKQHVLKKPAQHAPRIAEARAEAAETEAAQLREQLERLQETQLTRTDPRPVAAIS